MHRFLPYQLLLFGVIILQTLVFDRLMISHALSPLIYVSFLILLPMQTKQINMLLWGLTLGIFADFTMGLAGVNTIVAVLIAYSRISFLLLCVGEKRIALRGSPTPKRIDKTHFALYSGSMIICFHSLFFWVETLSMNDVSFFFARLFLSSTLCFVLVWAIASLFGSLLKRY